MDLVIATEPTIEPISAEQLKLHLRMDDESFGLEYDLLTDHIKTARGHVEDITHRGLLTQTWDYYLDAFPAGDSFKLPLGKLASVTHIKYTDSDGDQTTMTVTTEYLVETNGDQCGRIVLPYGVSWPSFTAYTTHPIVVRFVCGWTTAAGVPAKIRTAVKMIAARLYEDRGENVVGQSVAEDKFYKNLLNKYILWEEF